MTEVVTVERSRRSGGSSLAHEVVPSLAAWA